MVDYSTLPMPGPVRTLHWEASSRKDLMAMPATVRKDLGVALLVVQMGRTPPCAKAWRGLGPGVYELVDDHMGDAFRAVYCVGLGDAVHVLHVFQKKSKRGVATPLTEVARVERRFKALLARYGRNGRK